MRFDLRVLGGALLVAGTTIGAAVLALPVTTGIAGLWPSLALFVICWAFMLYTGFLLLEVNHTVGGTANLITMARATLGRFGEAFAWIFYILLLYTLTAAYLSGCGAVLVGQLQALFGFALPDMLGPVPFVILFGFLVFLGVRPVDYINRLLMVGLGATFVMLLVAILPNIEVKLLERSAPAYTLLAIPVVVTSFGYHIIIPSLATYLDHNIGRIKKAILWGSAFPVVVYSLWTTAILGVVPLGGEEGLLAALHSGQPAAALSRSLEQFLSAPWVAWISSYFSLFTILTSILGVSLSLSDCLADGLKIEKNTRGRFVLSLLTFIPPLIFAWSYPKGFVVALSYGGAIIAILLGILPAAMVWSERYVRHSNTEYHTIGGRGLLLVTALFFIGVVVLQFLQKPIQQLLQVS
jgi:tyrosine-specific transport protein